jgi:hypothetical protein
VTGLLAEKCDFPGGDIVHGGGDDEFLPRDQLAQHLAPATSIFAASLALASATAWTNALFFDERSPGTDCDAWIAGVKFSSILVILPSLT